MSISKPVSYAILFTQLVITAVFALMGAGLDYDNRIECFAVAHREAEARYKVFSGEFAASEHVIVSARLRSARHDLDQVEAIFKELAAHDGIQTYHSLHSLFPERSGKLLEPLPFYDPDQGIYTAFFELKLDGDRHATLQHLIVKGHKLLHLNRESLSNLVVAGEPVVNYHLDQSSREVKETLFPLLIAIVFLLLGVLFRSLKVLVVTALSVGTGLAMTMGILYLAGQSMNLVTTLIPALTFVLAVAMQVHVLISIAVEGSPMEGLIRKIKPNFLVAFTTSIGFGSLMSSEVLPIVQMGKFMAIGIWVVFIWVHLTHLGLSLLLKLRVEMPHLSNLDGLAKNRFYQTFISKPITLILPLAVIVLGYLAILNNPTESNGLSYFEDRHPIRQNTQFLQAYVTGGSELELLIANPGERNGDAYMPEGESLPKFEQTLLADPKIRHLVSLNQFARLMEEEETELDDTLLMPFLSEDFYRMKLLVDALGKEEYDLLLQRIRAIEAQVGLPGPVMVTGALDRIIEIQRYLLDSLAKSLTITIVAVLLLLVLLLRSPGYFGAILFANLFPLGGMAVAMWVFGFHTSISTVMVFSIAFGIAVDDSIHLLHTFKGTDGSFEKAWTHTLTRDARAICLTTQVLTVGFAMLISSAFLPTRQFGILLALGMVLALLGDLCFLPGLLRRSSRQMSIDG